MIVEINPAKTEHSTLHWLGPHRLPILRVRDRLVPWQMRHFYYRHEAQAKLGARFSIALTVAHFLVLTLHALVALPLDALQSLAILISGLKSSSRQISLTRGKQLYKTNEPANDVMLLSQGYGRLCMEQEDGRRLTVGLVAPGDLFGEEALLDEPKRESAFEAVLDSQVEIITREDFTRLVHENPALMWSITAHLAQRLLTQQHHMVRLAFEPLEQRLAWILLELATAAGTIESSAPSITIYHKDLAALLGVWRETITAMLNRWSSDGLIEQQARHITLKDLQRLRKLADD
jgi:CRP/FNR family transcriptional regulator, cyclic AMP receptor protein